MLMVTHAVVGSAVGKSVRLPWLALPAAFISHFVLDFIPHSSFHMIPNPNSVLSALRLAGPFLETVLAVLLIRLIWPFPNRWLMIWAGVAAALMDILDYVPAVRAVFHTIPGSSALSWVHANLHNDISAGRWELGFLTQAIVAAVALRVIMKPARAVDGQLSSETSAAKSGV